MPATPHVEHHFMGSEAVRDVVVGMADGLTIPFALAAGLSAAVTSGRIIVTAGLAEIAAGAIAMGLGGYLAARTDQEHYASEEERERREARELPPSRTGRNRKHFSRVPHRHPLYPLFWRRRAPGRKQRAFITERAGRPARAGGWSRRRAGEFPF